MEQRIEDLERIDPTQPSATDDASSFAPRSDRSSASRTTFRKLVGDNRGRAAAAAG